MIIKGLLEKVNKIDIIAYYYYKNIVEAVYSSKFDRNEEILLVQDCEDNIHIEKAKNYNPYTCCCGVKWSVRYRGVLEVIFSQIEQDILDYIYSK